MQEEYKKVMTCQHGLSPGPFLQAFGLRSHPGPLFFCKVTLRLSFTSLSLALVALEHMLPVATCCIFMIGS